MSLFNQTIGIKFFVDGEEYVKGQQYGDKIGYTFELLKMSEKLKKLFKKEKLAIGDVFYDREEQYVHVIALQKTQEDIETVTSMNNIFGYKDLMVYSFSLFKYFSDKQETIRTQVTLRYLECKEYDLEYCGNIFADIHAVNHFFVQEKITDGSSHFMITNNLNHIKELNLPHIQKTALFFYTKNENGETFSNYCHLSTTSDLKSLETLYEQLNNHPYSLYININNTHQLVQNGYYEFKIKQVKDKIFGYFLTITEYGEVLLIDDRGNEIIPIFINANYELDSFIDTNHFDRESEKDKLMSKLHNLISAM